MNCNYLGAIIALLYYKQESRRVSNKHILPPIRRNFIKKLADIIAFLSRLRIKPTALNLYSESSKG